MLKKARNERLEVLVQLCHRVLAGSRGAAITLARVDFGVGTLTWTGVGNVTAHLVAKAATGTNIRSSARLAAGIDSFLQSWPGIVALAAGCAVVLDVENALRRLQWRMPHGRHPDGKTAPRGHLYVIEEEPAATGTGGTD